MTSSIPDGISFSDLDALRQQAAAEEPNEAKHESPTYAGKTQDEVLEIAVKLCDQAIEECNDPIIHKAMIIHMLENMIRWHTAVGMDQDTERSTICWLRDAGKFQATANILSSISCGPDDFLME